MIYVYLDRYKKSIGVYYLFSADQICLSVGETCGLPRANTVRPYRASGKLPYEKEPLKWLFCCGTPISIAWNFILRFLFRA